MRGREFIMKDAYSFHADDESLDTMYWTMHNAYTNIFNRCGLNFRPVEADSGNIGGSITHEFHVLADSGEDTIAFCDTCNYAANVEKATSRETASAAQIPVDALSLAEVATPDKKSIEDVAAFLNVPPEKTIKMLIYQADGENTYIAVCIRGDLTVNEIKLRTILGAHTITVPDEAAVIKTTGLPVGYFGACNLVHPLIREVIADTSVLTMTDSVCGANKEGFHLTHVYPQRDMTVTRYADVHFVAEGDGCPHCNGTLKLRKGIEVGQVFKLGRKYAKPMNLTFLTDSNAEQEMTMGCYGIGVGRTAAAAVEQNYDNDGIIWPLPIAPYTVALLCLDTTDNDCRTAAQGIHDELEAKGIDVLFDDRAERPGIKFKDADLIGCPIRVTVGVRGLKEGIVELKQRNSKEVHKISKETVISAIMDIIRKNLA
jgi:prolyl-tRNA synthetase